MKGLPVKATVTKYEDIEVDIDVEQIEILMCSLLKADYEENREIFGREAEELLEAIQIVYEAYSGKPIDYVERFAH